MVPIYRLFAMSDLHTDAEENRQFVDRVDSTAHSRDALIVAGDISHSIAVMRATLRGLRSKFAHVFFVPGNHELWLTRRGKPSNDEEVNDPLEDGLVDSLEKVAAIERMCGEEGVKTRPCKLPIAGDSRSLWVVPLLSWHCQSFDSEPEIDARWEGLPTAEQLCTDYHVCKWPPSLQSLGHGSDAVAECLDALNDTGAGEETDALFRGGRASADDIVVSFSHFLPRVELIPEKRYLYFPALAKFVGSPALGRRVASLRPDAHVFGHTHFGWDQELDGVRYLSPPVAMPRERVARLCTIATGPFPNSDEEATVPLLVWDASLPDRGLPAQYPAAWSGFYEAQPRTPDRVLVLPEYVATNYKWNEKLHGSKADVTGWDGKTPPRSFGPAWTLQPKPAKLV